MATAVHLLPWRTILGAVIHEGELGSQSVDIVAGVGVGRRQGGQESHEPDEQTSTAERRHDDERVRVQRSEWQSRWFVSMVR